MKFRVKRDIPNFDKDSIIDSSQVDFHPEAYRDIFINKRVEDLAELIGKIMGEYHRCGRTGVYGNTINIYLAETLLKNDLVNLIRLDECPKL